MIGAPTTTGPGAWKNKQAGQRYAKPGRYTPLVPRPEGGALVSIAPRTHDTTTQARRTAVTR